ncbi:hypothetical protein SAMN05216249_102207 [Acetitomaculum ruminis DSM 5522]|uniref:Uncharacterized protein n=1 Tax=Acetitomaculum ruminis DSM 5522 TaxID=1120918 RepID=A0A1I0VUM5_9FIRM|nr:hypothetical protein [Acetitomaculum ruminis]SFA80022.1 hypothetical protein SAMN05216249_102207 [Acetitomaculum ruminis DSM 5522]
MKLGEAIPIFRDYRKKLVDETRNLVKKRDAAQKNFEITGEQHFADEAASLQLSVEQTDEEFKKNQEILDSLAEQHCLAWNAEVARQVSDPETGYAATLGKILTTVARMCAGDKVPYSDEKKVLEYDSEMYARAKQAQMIMAALKEKQKEYDSLWDDEEETNKYDPQKAADEAEANIDISCIPDTDIDLSSEAVTSDLQL